MKDMQEKVNFYKFGDRLKDGRIKVHAFGPAIMIVEKRFHPITGEEIESVTEGTTLEKLVAQKRQFDEEYRYKSKWIQEAIDAVKALEESESG